MRNPLNQKDYDDILSSIQFHQLTCTCGHSACLSVHGYYLRGLKTLTASSGCASAVSAAMNAAGHTHSSHPSSSLIHRYPLPTRPISSIFSG